MNDGKLGRLAQDDDILNWSGKYSPCSSTHTKHELALAFFFFFFFYKITYLVVWSLVVPMKCFCPT